MNIILFCQKYILKNESFENWKTINKKKKKKNIHYKCIEWNEIIFAEDYIQVLLNY